ncbi:MAG: sugar transferase [Campylobacterota bacterium]|nr:sugar transferase [Campylobacterota bacterium]
MLAPIVLFTYNRLTHTQRTVEALSKNLLAKESELFIYSDAAENENEKQKVIEVRKYLKTIKGFKSIQINEQITNKGLPNSISFAVTDIVNKFGKVIVVEDDIVTSPYFLTFMNDSLNYYKDNKNIWHISGWNFPIDNNGLNDTFLWRAAQVWGWGTWKDRWQHYKKDPDYLIDTYSDYDIYKYNLDDVMLRWENEIIRNKEGTLNTWAAFWYATIFKNNGLCVQASQTFVENIGRDGSGTTNSNDPENKYASDKLCNKKVSFANEIKENDIAVYRIKNFWKEIIIGKNENLIFSRNYNSLLKQIDNLKKENSKYILYGAGKIGELVLNLIPDHIEYIVDGNEEKHYTIMNNKNIYPLNQLKQNNNKVIISVLGREKIIIKLLIEKYDISKDEIIYFDFN